METISVILSIINFLIFIGILFLSSYFKKKGENLATKEDISEITDKVENVKTSYATSLEKFKSELTKQLYIHNLQYDSEYKIYLEIWEELIEVRNATLKMRPMFDTSTGDKEGRKQERLKIFADCFNKFHLNVDKKRPFYVESVYKELYELIKIVHTEYIDYQYGEEYDKNYWKDANDNADKIISQIDAICNKIRERIFKIIVA